MNSADLTESLEKLRAYHIPYVWVTQGENGAAAVTANQTLHVSAKESAGDRHDGSGRRIDGRNFMVRSRKRIT